MEKITEIINKYKASRNQVRAVSDLQSKIDFWSDFLIECTKFETANPDLAKHPDYRGYPDSAYAEREKLEKQLSQNGKAENNEGTRPGYSSKNPLLNYRTFKWTLEAYFLNVDLYITDGKRIIEFTHKLLYDDGIHSIAHRAKIEIEDLVLTPNNNADRLLKEAFDKSDFFFNETDKVMEKNKDIYMDLPKYQSFHNVRQLLVDFNWEIRVLIAKGSNQTLGPPYIEPVYSAAIAKGLKPAQPEYYAFINEFKDKEKKEAELKEQKEKPKNDEITDFIELIASNARGKASGNVEELFNHISIKLSTQKQKIAFFKKHLALFQQASVKFDFPVSDEAKLYEVIKNAVESKKVYKDKGRVWINCDTKQGVFNEIKSPLYSDFSDYFTSIELAEVIDAFERGEGTTSNLSNKEFLKGKVTIGFINGEHPTFKVKKSIETRTLLVVSFFDAHLSNWESAIDNEKDFDKKVEILHNAKKMFSDFNYEYPNLKNEVSRVVTRLNEIGEYLEYWQNKSKNNNSTGPIEIPSLTSLAKKSDTPKELEPITYTWKGDFNKLRTLYRKLKENGLIAMETDVHTFTCLFSGKPENAIVKPIQWLVSNRLLAYLLFELHKSTCITNEHWQSIADKGKLFVNKKGKAILKNDLAQPVNSSNKFSIKPNGSDIIDKVLK